MNQKTPITNPIFMTVDGLLYRATEIWRNRSGELALIVGVHKNKERMFNPRQLRDTYRVEALATKGA